MRKLKEDLARDRVIKVCDSISSDNEKIIFLDWKESKFIGYKTRLILYNSKTEEVWDTAIYNTFVNHPTKGTKKTSFKKLSDEKRDKKGDIVLKRIIELNKDKNWIFPKKLENYQGYRTKVSLFCTEIDPITKKVHGEFISTPDSLLNKHTGCPRCGGNHHYTTEEFIERAKIVHRDKYSYEKTNYINNRTEVIITCPKHGDFKINPDNFIRRGDGCKKCNNSKGESKLIEALEELSLNYTYHYKLDSSLLENCPNKKYIEIDFKLEFMGKIIWIEFQGEQHYHKSPGKFKNHRRTDRTFSEQVQRDLSIRNYALENGIEFLEIPYLDIDSIPEILQAFLFEGKDITTKIKRDDYSEDF